MKGKSCLLAKLSFVLAIFGFIWSFFTATVFVRLFSEYTLLFSYFLFIISIVFGIIGLIQIKRNKLLSGKGFSWFGIILSILGMIGAFLTRPIYKPF